MNDQNAAQIENLTNLISALDGRVSSLSNSMSSLTGNTQDMTNAISNAEKSAGGLKKAFSGTQNVFNEIRNSFRENANSFENYNIDIRSKAEKANNDLMKRYGLFFRRKEKAHLSHYKSITELLRDHVREQIGIFHNLPTVKSRVLLVVDAIRQAFTKTLGLIANLGLSVVSVLTNIAGSILNISKLLISLPFKTLESMLEIANSVKEEFLAISQTLEDTQEQISGASRLGVGLRDLSNDVRELGDEFLNAGSLSARIFGYGLEGQRSQITKTSEKISGLKSLGNLIGSTFINSSLEIEVAMQSLGMSIDDVSNLVRKSISEGVHPIQGLVNAFNASTAAAREFGVDQKFIARGMNTLRNNVVEFSHISEPELARVTAQAAQLGVEAEGLVAIFNKFTTFDAAAESAALLSQTFGMAIDAMDIIRAEDPLEILNQFREGMEQTGRSFSDLNRHEKALLSQYTGLSGEMLQTAMSFDGVGLSYEELQQKMEESSPERQLQNAVNAMTESVREFMNVGKQITNPFQAISEGMKDAILKNASLQRSLVNLSNSARDIYENILNTLFTGDTGRQIQETLRQVIDSFNNLFAGNAANKFAEMAQKILVLINTFFDFRKSTQDMSNAFKDLQESFFENDFVIRLIGLGKIMIGNIVSGFIKSLPMLIEGFTELLSMFNSILFGTTYTSENSRLGDWFNTYIGEAWNSIKARVPNLVESLLEQLKIAIRGSSGAIFSIGAEIGKGIFSGMKNTLVDSFTSNDSPSWLPVAAISSGAALTAATASSAASTAASAATAGGATRGAAILSASRAGLSTATSSLLGAGMVAKDIIDVGSDLYNDRAVKNEDVYGIGGAALGGIIGSIILPGIGTGIGMAAGNMIGEFLGSSEDEQERSENIRANQESERIRAAVIEGQNQRAINNNNSSMTPTETTINMPVMLDGTQIANNTVAILQDSTGRFSLITDDGNVKLVDRSGQGSTDVTGTA
tara:strand:+ start:1413 stop:4346 length:2934 start_codon:yes stop_codon:yes gene_type:complete